MNSNKNQLQIPEIGGGLNDKDDDSLANEIKLVPLLKEIPAVSL